jgi:putative phosphoribosyl transferase
MSDRGIVFADRRDAGRRLAEAVAPLDLPSNAIVGGIPRGGVIVAAEVAARLGTSVRAIVAGKVGAPGHRELAIGAVGPDGAALLDEDLCRRVGATSAWLARAVDEVRVAVAARIAELPSVLDAPQVRDRAVVVCDDGVATGSTATAVGRWLRASGAARTVLALPCGPPDTVERLASEYDDVVVLSAPTDFVAVGQWYRSFPQTTTEEVRELLA